MRNMFSFVVGFSMKISPKILEGNPYKRISSTTVRFATLIFQDLGFLSRVTLFDFNRFL